MPISWRKVSFNSWLTFVTTEGVHNLLNLNSIVLFHFLGILVVEYSGTLWQSSFFSLLIDGPNNFLAGNLLVVTNFSCPGYGQRRVISLWVSKNGLNWQSLAKISTSCRFYFS